MVIRNCTHRNNGWWFVLNIGCFVLRTYFVCEKSKLNTSQKKFISFYSFFHFILVEKIQKNGVC